MSLFYALVEGFIRGSNPYLILDARYEKVRGNAVIRSRAVRCCNLRLPLINPSTALR